MNIRSRNVALPTLKRVVQLIGTLGGVFGLAMFPITAGMFAAAVSNSKPADFLFPVFFLMVDVYLLWLGYFVWARFSPRAVLHVCGIIGFFTLGIPGTFIPSPAYSAWHSFAYLAWLLFVIFCYRWLSNFLNRRIFVSPPSLPCTRCSRGLSRDNSPPSRPHPASVSPFVPPDFRS